MRINIYIVAIAFCSLFVASSLFAQNEQGTSLRDRIANRQKQEQGLNDKKNSLPQLSVRAQMKNENNTQDISNATWVREVYRFLDLTKGPNAALFYPVTPIGDRMNLYTLIFSLMASGELEAYDFNGGEPVFAEQFRTKPKDMFERLEIAFKEENGRLIYDEFSVPSNEVLGYYIKEAWYFDQANSVLDVKTVAICPVLFRNALDGFDMDMSEGASTREPQFWIPYENIRPYAARMPIMTSDINNKMSKMIDDYFRLRLYEGEIYKTTNMENKILIEKYKTPEEVQKAQQVIEKQLADFEEGLWVINDSTKVSSGDPVKRKIEKRDQPKKSSSSDAKHSARERRKTLAM